jgi:hypothetical protein
MRRPLAAADAGVLAATDECGSDPKHDGVAMMVAKVTGVAREMCLSLESICNLQPKLLT